MSKETFNRATEPLVLEARLAVSLLDRMRGLLGRPPLTHNQALFIVPCNSVHTAGMGYALDIVFLAKDGAVLKLVPGLAPWRTAACLRAHATVELAAGGIDRLGLAAGQRLAFRHNPARNGHGLLCLDERRTGREAR